MFLYNLSSRDPDPVYETSAIRVFVLLVSFSNFSLPGQSPGRAIVLLPASALAAAAALAKSLMLKFFM